MKHTKIFSALMLGLAVSNTSFADTNEEWKISFGTDFSSGSYDDPVDTDITYLPVSISRKSGPWTAKVSAAWLEIDGPGTVVGGGDGGVVIGSGGMTTRSESGFGDIWASLGYELQSFPQEYGYLDLVAKVKLPTADEDKQLGTGEVDYTLQADWAYSMGRLTPLVSLAYKIKGDPGGYKLDNVFYLSTGADWKLSDDTHIGASLDFQQSATNADDSLELFTYLNYRLSNDWKVTPYVYIGLSDGSPDQGMGVQMMHKF